MKKNKKILISSLVLLSSISTSALFGLTYLNTKNLRLTNDLSTKANKSLHNITQSSKTTVDSSNYEKYGKAVVDNSIKDFTKYNSVYEDRNISPVVTKHGTIGMPHESLGDGMPTTDSNDISNFKKTLALTDYNGLLLWTSNLSKNVLLQNYYNKNYSNDNKSTFDISKYTIKNYIYLEDKEALIVLYGGKDNTNQVIFSIDFNTGNIIVPDDGANLNKDGTIFANAPDGAKMLYINSAGQIIASSGGTYSEYSTKTNIHSFSKISGFTLVNTMASTDGMFYLNKKDSTDKSILTNIVRAKNGINFAIFIDDTRVTNKKYGTTSKFLYNTGKEIKSVDAFGFSYKIVCVDDNLNNSGKLITSSGAYYSATNELSSTLDSSFSFDNVIKRAYFVQTTDKTSKLALWCHSYLEEFSQIDTITFTPSSEKNNSSIQGKFTNEQYKLSEYNKELNATNSFNQGKLLKNDVNISQGSWRTNSIDYSEQTETFIFSQSSRINVNWYNKYYADTRIIHFDKSSKKYIAGFETDSDKTYDHEQRIALIPNQYTTSIKKLSIANNETNNKKVYFLSSREKNSENYTFKEIGVNNNSVEIQDNLPENFYKLSTINNTKLLNEVKLKNKMPSAFDESDLANLVTVDTDESTKDTFSTSVNSIKANDNTGELSFDLIIIHNTPIPTLPNPSFTKHYDLTNLYSFNEDFSPFKKHSENSVVSYINNKMASSLTIEDVLNNLIDTTKIKDAEGKVVTVTTDEISLTPDDDKGTLLVTITLSNDKLSKMPTGFSKVSENKLSTIFSGFNVTKPSDQVAVKVGLSIVGIAVAIIIGFVIYMIIRNKNKNK